MLAVSAGLIGTWLTPRGPVTTPRALASMAAALLIGLVDGRILKKDGALTTIDMVQALTEAQIRVEGIIARFFHEHPDQQEAWEQRAP